MRKEQSAQPVSRALSMSQIPNCFAIHHRDLEIRDGLECDMHSSAAPRIALSLEGGRWIGSFALSDELAATISMEDRRVYNASLESNGSALFLGTFDPSENPGMVFIFIPSYINRV